MKPKKKRSRITDRQRLDYLSQNKHDLVYKSAWTGWVVRYANYEYSIMQETARKAIDVAIIAEAEGRVK